MDDVTKNLTPEQVNELINKLSDIKEQQDSVEIGEQPATADPKKTSLSILIINISYILFGLCGVVGSLWSGFDMTKYVQFLQVFAWIWAPLVIAVGGGRAIKNVAAKKYGNGGDGTTSPTTTGSYRKKR